MTRMRTKIVNGAMLADLCSKGTRLKDFVRKRRAKAQHSDDDSGGEERGTKLRDLVRSRKKAMEAGDGRSYGHDPVMEDVFEAFLGAMFLQFGFDTVDKWLVAFLESHVDFAHLVAHQNNPKDVLNRYFVAQHGALPTFEEAHSASTTAAATVVIRNKIGTIVATGTGANRREAENDAARKALTYYDVPKGLRV